MSSATIVVISPCGGGNFCNEVERTCISHEGQCNLRKLFEDDIIELMLVGINRRQSMSNLVFDGISSIYMVIIPIYLSGICLGMRNRFHRTSEVEIEG